MHAYWVAFIVLPSSLPAQITSLFSSCACKFVVCFFDYTYLWNLCSYYCDFKKKVGSKWNCCVKEYFVLFGRWFRQCCYRYICNSKNSRERSKMWIVILAADKYFLPPCFISSFELFCFGRKKTLIDKVRDFGSLCALWFPDDYSNEREKEYS